MSRRKGRILAFQALYSYDVGGVSLDDLLKLEWTENDWDSEEKSEDVVAQALETKGPVDHSDSEVEDYARILIAGTINHIDEVDESIKAHLSATWDFSRVNKVSLAILRMSVYSLLFQKDLHPTIVIDEAIDIAKQYGADDSFKFINAVLDSIRKETAE